MLLNVSLLRKFGINMIIFRQIDISGNLSERHLKNKKLKQND